MQAWAHPGSSKPYQFLFLGNFLFIFKTVNCCKHNNSTKPFADPFIHMSFIQQILMKPLPMQRSLLKTTRSKWRAKSRVSLDSLTACGPECPSVPVVSAWLPDPHFYQELRTNRVSSGLGVSAGCLLLASSICMILNQTCPLPQPFYLN